MRREIVVLGFFIIVLILIAGCTSPQSGAAAGTKSQNPSVIPTSQSIGDLLKSAEKIRNCSQQPTDPLKFQKFIPSPPPSYTQFECGKNGVKSCPSYSNQTGGGSSALFANYGNFTDIEYPLSPENPNKWANIIFQDYGPCTDSSYLINSYYYQAAKQLPDTSAGLNGTISMVDNFHGYPAIRTVGYRPYSNLIGTVEYQILVSNRLLVTIDISDNNSPEGGTISDLESNIDKFANAIDFKGFAASV